jgi:hypothetical protein
VGIKDLWDAVKDRYRDDPHKDVPAKGSRGDALHAKLVELCHGHAPAGRWPCDSHTVLILRAVPKEARKRPQTTDRRAR